METRTLIRSLNKIKKLHCPNESEECLKNVTYIWKAMLYIRSKEGLSQEMKTEKITQLNILLDRFLDLGDTGDINIKNEIITIVGESFREKDFDDPSTFPIDKWVTDIENQYTMYPKNKKNQYTIVLNAIKRIKHDTSLSQEDKVIVNKLNPKIYFLA